MEKAHSNTADLITEFWAAPAQARFSQKTVAAVLNRSESWVEKTRSVGGGPPFIRTGGTQVIDKHGKEKLFGGRADYVKSDVVEYMDTQCPVRNTTEARCPAQAAAA